MKKESILGLVDMDLKEEGEYSYTVVRERKDAGITEIKIRRL